MTPQENWAGEARDSIGLTGTRASCATPGLSSLLWAPPEAEPSRMGTGNGQTEGAADGGELARVGRGRRGGATRRDQPGYLDRDRAEPDGFGVLLEHKGRGDNR